MSYIYISNSLETYFFVKICFVEKSTCSTIKNSTIPPGEAKELHLRSETHNGWLWWPTAHGVWKEILRDKKYPKKLTVKMSH